MMALLRVELDDFDRLVVRDVTTGIELYSRTVSSSDDTATQCAAVLAVLVYLLTYTPRRS